MDMDIDPVGQFRSGNGPANSTGKVPPHSTRQGQKSTRLPPTQRITLVESGVLDPEVESAIGSPGPGSVVVRFVTSPKRGEFPGEGGMFGAVSIRYIHFLQGANSSYLMTTTPRDRPERPTASTHGRGEVDEAGSDGSQEHPAVSNLVLDGNSGWGNGGIGILDGNSGWGDNNTRDLVKFYVDHDENEECETKDDCSEGGPDESQLGPIRVLQVPEVRMDVLDDTLAVVIFDCDGIRRAVGGRQSDPETLRGIALPMAGALEFRPPGRQGVTASEPVWVNVIYYDTKAIGYRVADDDSDAPPAEEDCLE